MCTIQEGNDYTIELFKILSRDDVFYSIKDSNKFVNIAGIKLLFRDYSKYSDSNFIHSVILPETGTIKVLSDLISGRYFEISGSKLILDKPVSIDKFISLYPELIQYTKPIIQQQKLSDIQFISDIKLAQEFCLKYWKNQKFDCCKFHSDLSNAKSVEQIVEYVFNNCNYKNEFINYCFLWNFYRYRAEFSDEIIKKIYMETTTKSLHDYYKDMLTGNSNQNHFGIILQIYKQRKLSIPLKCYLSNTYYIGRLKSLGGTIFSDIITYNLIQMDKNSELNIKIKQAIWSIINPPKELQLVLLNKYPKVLRKMIGLDRDILIEYVKLSKRNIFYVKNITREIFNAYTNRFSRLTLEKNYNKLNDITNALSYTRINKTKIIERFDYENFMKYWKQFAITNPFVSTKRLFVKNKKNSTWLCANIDLFFSIHAHQEFFERVYCDFPINFVKLVIKSNQEYALKYYPKFYARFDEYELIQLIEFEPKIFKYVPKSLQTEIVCIKALEFDLDNKKHIKNWTLNLYNLII